MLVAADGTKASGFSIGEMTADGSSTLGVAHLRTVAFSGIDVRDVDVQVQISSGLPAFTVVGLPDKAVAESRERVRSALGAMGLGLPPKRITVNLAPADLAKEGSHFDLPIALGLLVSMGALPADATEGYMALGELALDGAIMPVSGVLPAAVAAASREVGLICPAACGGEAAWLGSDIEVLAAPNLLALINHFNGAQVLSPPAPALARTGGGYPELSDIKGQETANRGLEIAAAGSHNLLLLGPPGSGKSMLAARLPGLLPALDPAEILEVSMVASVAGLLHEGRLTERRPFRSPHHATWVAAMVGGGPHARPGEISLAHIGDGERLLEARHLFLALLTLAAGAAPAGAVDGSPARCGACAWTAARGACSSSTSCRSSAAPCSRACASRSRAGGSRWRVPTIT
jgi:magnesium chelatase family protein